MKKIIPCHFLFFIILLSTNSCQVNSTAIRKNKEGFTDYSGDYILEGKTVSVPEKDSYEKQQTVQRYNEMLHIRLKDMYSGEYEMSWRVLPETHQPESVEAVKVFISQDGKIHGEFRCYIRYKLIQRPSGKIMASKGRKGASSDEVNLVVYDRNEKGFISGEIKAVSKEELDAMEKAEKIESEEAKVDYRPKCIFEGNLLDNKKLTVHYLIKDYKDVLIFEGWRNGIREKTY
jgi:hypothetical protein